MSTSPPSVEQDYFEEVYNLLVKEDRNKECVFQHQEMFCTEPAPKVFITKRETQRMHYKKSKPEMKHRLWYLLQTNCIDKALKTLPRLFPKLQGQGSQLPHGLSWLDAPRSRTAAPGTGLHCRKL